MEQYSGKSVANTISVLSTWW